MPIKKLFCIVVAIQLAILGLIGLAHLGYNIPVLRQIVGFIFLTFVPGILILRILKVHNISIVELILYSVGLSLASVMFSGLFINASLPYLGISKPISTLPVTSTLLVFTVILSIVAYIRNRNFQPSVSTKVKTEAKESPLSLYLFLILLPLLAALGALLVMSHQNNVLLLMLIPIIALVPALVVFNKFTSPKIYLLAIIAIALALIYQSCLTSLHLTGWDIFREYYVQNSVVANSHWDATIFGNLNGMLSIVMLWPIYSLVLGIDATWIFKTIYPFIFCLIPLGLFQIFRGQIGERRAFLAVFLFITVFGWEIGAGGNSTRLRFAEIFFVLLMLLMVDKKLLPMPRGILAIIFAMALAVSHYGISYIFLFLLVLSLALLYLMNSKIGGNLWRQLAQKFGKAASLAPQMINSPPLLRGTFVSLCIVFALSWYMYTSSGSSFSAIVGIGQQVYDSLGELFGHTTREPLMNIALGGGWSSTPTWGKAFRVIQYLIQFFIMCGIVRLILRPGEFRYDRQWIALAIATALFLFIYMAIPFFSFAMFTYRVYYLSLFVLSPLCILGGEAVWQGIMRLARRRHHLATSDASVYFRIVTLVVLILYFLFNTGFIFEAVKLPRGSGVPSQNSLSGYRVDCPYYNQKEDAGARWVTNMIDERDEVYTDVLGYSFLGARLGDRVCILPADVEGIQAKRYIYFRTWNVKNRELCLYEQYPKVGYFSLDGTSPLSEYMRSKNLVYNNGGCQVFAPEAAGR